MELERAKTHAPPAGGDPQTWSRPALRRELLTMEDRDQQARNPDSIGAEGEWDPAAAAHLAAMDAENLQRLKHILRQDGFPTVAMVGREGIHAAWILIQHADSDPQFQASILKVLDRRARRGEVRLQDVALLTDRVLRAEGKPQRYGSQFEVRDRNLVPQPIEDEANVDKRRHAVGLPSMQAYTCMLRAVYSTLGERQP